MANNEKNMTNSEKQQQTLHPAEKYPMKQGFVERYKQLTDFEAFKACSYTFLRKSIRVNILKTTVAAVKKRLSPDWNLTAVPWCKEGMWIEHKGVLDEETGELKKRRDIGNLPEHVLGHIYVQEAASMLPPLVLNPKPGDVVLDMCAAPGSKTTQMAQYMKNTGIILANDINHHRLASLGVNIQRCGISNTLLTQMKGHRFKKVPIEFDKILVDAPCSGTGTIRKSYRVIEDWSPGLVKRIVGTQKNLIKTAFEILKPGGNMVYSTCTCEPEENEGVVSHLLETFDNAKLEKISLPLKQAKPIMKWQGETYHKDVEHCLRIWPQDNDSEGFFVAKIRKM
jgi:tRNA (cytosine49-C5)-methyltransferase